MTKHDAATDFGADMDYKELVASVAVHYGVIKIHGQKKSKSTAQWYTYAANRPLF